MADHVLNALGRLAEKQHPARRDKARMDTLRQVFHINTVLNLAPGGSIADIGGGIGLFSAGCASLGFEATLIDDFADPVNATYGDEALDLHRSVGVKIESRDVIRDGLGLPPASMDIICTFDSMEHWHDSPKSLFAEVITALRPGGWVFIGVPNCVNFRKRITVPLGRGKWSTMADWYEQPRFRGHVREPDVSDLHYIARDMGLTETTVLGRNWQALKSPRWWVKAIGARVDPLLRWRPALCSDIYLIGRRP